jgi:hypothetical protein
MLAAGKELAEAAKQGLGQNMEFEDISEYVSQIPFPKSSELNSIVFLRPSLRFTIH